jgi:hypothetical protein
VRAAGERGGVREARGFTDLEKARSCSGANGWAARMRRLPQPHAHEIEVQGGRWRGRRRAGGFACRPTCERARTLLAGTASWVDRRVATRQPRDAGCPGNDVKRRQLADVGCPRVDGSLRAPPSPTATIPSRSTRPPKIGVSGGTRPCASRANPSAQLSLSVSAGRH